MTVNYGNNPNLDHWVREDPEAQAAIDNQIAGQEQFQLHKTEDMVRKVVRRVFDDDERGGISERDRLGIPLNEHGEREEWPSFFDDGKEGRQYSKLSNPSYWRAMGPNGHMSSQAVKNAYQKVISRIRSAEIDAEQLQEEGDINEYQKTVSRMRAWLGVKKMIDESNDTRDIRERIGRD